MALLYSFLQCFEDMSVHKVASGAVDYVIVLAIESRGDENSRKSILTRVGPTAKDEDSFLGLEFSLSADVGCRSDDAAWWGLGERLTGRCGCHRRWYVVVVGGSRGYLVKLIRCEWRRRR